MVQADRNLGHSNPQEVYRYRSAISGRVWAMLAGVMLGQWAIRLAYNGWEGSQPGFYLLIMSVFAVLALAERRGWPIQSGQRLELDLEGLHSSLPTRHWRWSDVETLELGRPAPPMLHGAWLRVVLSSGRCETLRLSDPVPIADAPSLEEALARCWGHEPQRVQGNLVTADLGGRARQAGFLWVCIVLAAIGLLVVWVNRGEWVDGAPPAKLALAGATLLTLLVLIWTWRERPWQKWLLCVFMWPGALGFIWMALLAATLSLGTVSPRPFTLVSDDGKVQRWEGGDGLIVLGTAPHVVGALVGERQMLPVRRGPFGLEALRFDALAKVDRPVR